MKAEIITYKTQGMTNSKRSIISKKIFGYKDTTKESRYIYQREGVLEPIPNIVITKKTFVVISVDATKIKKLIKGLGATVKSWKIEIAGREMKKRYG